LVALSMASKLIPCMLRIVQYTGILLPRILAFFK
jgi:hypothetical protein